MSGMPRDSAGATGNRGPDPGFPVVDCHVHLYPDRIAPKVVPVLAGRFGNPPSFDGTVSGCARKDAESRISASVNLPVATKPDSVPHTNAFWAAHAPSAQSAAPAPRVYSLASMHPQVEDKAGEVFRIADAGFTGIKFHPEYQEFRFEDREMDDVWAAMAERGLVAWLHAGGERVFSAPYRSSPSTILDLKKRFPRLEVAAAHLGGFGMWDESEEVLAGSEVHLDLSHTFFWMPHERILRFIKKHGARRILFGTDAPWQDPAKVLAAFLELPLSEGDRRAICCENAVRLLRLPPPD